MRRMPGVMVALIALVSLAGVAPAAAQDARIHWHNFSASPTFFNPGDPITLSVSSEWDTNSDCQFYYGHYCDPYEATIQIWGSNGFSHTEWVPFPWNGWYSFNVTDWNPGSSSVTYEASLTVRWYTPWGPWSDWQTRYSTVYPAGTSFAYFYEHIWYGGNVRADTSDVAWVGDWWNDRISSVKVPAGKTVELFQHINFGGWSLVLTSDAPDLRNFYGPCNGNWNDCASSFKIY